MPSPDIPPLVLDFEASKAKITKLLHIQKLYNFFFLPPQFYQILYAVVLVSKLYACRSSKLQKIIWPADIDAKTIEFCLNRALEAVP